MSRSHQIRTHTAYLSPYMIKIYFTLIVAMAMWMVCMRPSPSCSDVPEEDRNGRRIPQEWELTLDVNGQLNNSILIYARMRTGSTFVSEFFNRHPSVFFIYEPLQRKSSFYTVLVNGTALVRDFLQCHFKDKAHNQTAFWFFNRFCKLRTLKMCEDFQKVVNDPNFTPYMERLCQEKSTRVVKEIQFRKLQYVTPLVSEGLRVVLLYRDPRGVLDGRRRSLPGRYNYTDGLEHQDISWYCYSMMRDWRYLVTLPWSVRQRYYIIRYEDIAINPVQGAVAMYNFLGITMDETVLSWARGVAKGNSTSTDGLYSTTRRNARHSAQIWRQQLDFSLVMQVQEACQDSMLHAGYPMVHTKQQLHDLDHFLLEAKDLNSQSEAKTAL